MRDLVHEEAFVRGFVRRERQDRWSTLLAHDRRRHEITKRLFHQYGDDLDPACMRLLDAAEQRDVLGVLRRAGAPAHCYLISGMPALDMVAGPLAEILEGGMYNSGTVVSCIPGKLAYLETEEMSERYLLRR